MTRRTEPFYFPSAERALFGLFQAPETQQRKEAIVICYPAPQEMMRSYQTHVQLGRELAELGYAVLRFDYTATGDSDGASAEASLKLWEADICAAANALKEKTGFTQVSLFGTRLGATLAMRASGKIGPQLLVLWDPLTDGAAYLKELESSHQLMLRRDPLEPPFAQSTQRPDQCWGFPLSAAFKQEIAAIKLSDTQVSCRKIHLLTSETRTPELAEQLRSSQATQVKLSEHLVEEAMHWLDDRFVKRRAFPSKHLRLIKNMMEG